jgi:hypothetical protein
VDGFSLAYGCILGNYREERGGNLALFSSYYPVPFLKYTIETKREIVLVVGR